MPPVQAQSEDVIVEFYNGTFLNKKGMKIFCYYWKPSTEPRALLLISHGYTEHGNVYFELAEEMAKKGFFVFAHDHIGHGHSEGTRAFVSSLHDLVADSISHINIVRKEYPNLPLFMCGHSMGGAVSVLTSLEKEVELSGICLIAPALATNPETATPFKMGIAKLLSKIFPHFPLAAPDFHLACQNEEKVQEMNIDPLRYKGYWKVRPILCLVNGAEEIQKKVSDVKVPLFILHGDNDKICHIDGSARLYEKSPSPDKTFKIYPGGYHSLLNEPEDIASDVLEKTVEWITARADRISKKLQT